MNPSPDEAREMIDRAHALARSAARFPLSWIGYSMLCTLGSTWLVASYATADRLSLFWLAVIGPWAVAGIVLSPLLAFFSRPTPKGFGTRWGMMMGLWAMAWVTSVTLSADMTTSQLVVLNLVYLALAIAGPIWELAALRRQEMA